MWWGLYETTIGIYRYRGCAIAMGVPFIADGRVKVAFDGWWGIEFIESGKVAGEYELF